MSERWHAEADVIVVGFGAAGACAAIEAADRSASALVVDRFRGGGATAISGGVVYAGGGPRKQVVRLMRTAGLAGDKTPKRWRTTTVLDPAAILPEDLIGCRCCRTGHGPSGDDVVVGEAAVLSEYGGATSMEPNQGST